MAPNPIENPKSKIQNPADDFRDFTWHWLLSAIRARLPLVGSFDDYPSEVYEIDYSPDGTLLAAACQRKIVVREVQSGEVRHEILAHNSSVTSLDFSPDGLLLASVGDDHHVRLWDLATGMLAADLGEHDCQTTAVAFSPDGSRLASGDDRGTFRIWDVAGRREQKTAKPHSRKIDGALFVDRDRLVTVSGDYYMIGWDIEAGVPRWKVWTPDEALMSMAVSPGGTTIATGNHFGGVGMWNTADGRRFGMLGTRQTLIQTVAFSSNGALIAAGGHDGIAQIWDVAAQTYCGQSLPHRERIWSVAFSPDGRTLATASRDRSVKLWDIAAQRQPRREKLDDLLFQIAFSDPEQTLAYFQDLGMRLWARGSAKSTPMKGRDVRRSHQSAVGWAAGKWFFCRRDGDRRAFDNTDDQICLVRPDADTIVQLAPSPDGQWLATRILKAGRESIEIWHVPSKRLRYACFGKLPAFTRNGEAYFVQHVDSPKGAHHRVMRLKLGDFECRAVEFEENDQVEPLAVSPDDRILAMGNVDSTIDLVETATGNRRRLVGHERAVWPLDFSPDGRTLASGGADGTVRLWRVDVGEPLGILERRTNGDVRDVKFSPDGQSLAVSGRDGLDAAVTLWEIEPK